MIPVVLLFPPRCSCSRQLGSIQHEFEDLVNSGLTPSDAADQLKLIMMCCRNAVLNCPMYFIRSTNQARIIDERKHINSPSRPSTSVVLHDRGHSYYEDTPEIPLTKTPPELPLIPGMGSVNLPEGFTLGALKPTTQVANYSIGGSAAIQQHQPLPVPQQSFGYQTQTVASTVPGVAMTSAMPGLGLTGQSVMAKAPVSMYAQQQQTMSGEFDLSAPPSQFAQAPPGAQTIQAMPMPDLDFGSTSVTPSVAPQVMSQGMFQQPNVAAPTTVFQGLPGSTTPVQPTQPMQGMQNLPGVTQINPSAIQSMPGAVPRPAPSAAVPTTVQQLPTFRTASYVGNGR